MRPILKKDSKEKIAICRSCNLTTCMQDSMYCPLRLIKNGKASILIEKAESAALIVKMLKEREKDEAIYEQISEEIARVKRMQARTTSMINKHRAETELNRLASLQKKYKKNILRFSDRQIALKAEAPVSQIYKQRAKIKAGLA